MPIINYSQWEKEDEHLTPAVVEMLLSNQYMPNQETMLYATKGKTKSVYLLNPKDLELLAVSYYERLPYKKVRYSGKHASSDGGVDVWLTRQDADIEIVQCKQLSAKVTKEQIKGFVKTMRQVGAIKGYYWAPAGFSKPADDYVESIKEKIILYDADIIVKEIYEIFHDEVQIARKKLKESIQETSPLNTAQNTDKTSIENIEHVENSKRTGPSVKNKVKKERIVAQVTIIFGLILVACSLIYCLFSSIVQAG